MGIPAKKKPGESNIPEIKPVLVLTNDEVELDAGESPIPALKLKKLKEFIRQRAKNRVFSANKIKKLNDLLETWFDMQIAMNIE